MAESQNQIPEDQEAENMLPNPSVHAPQNEHNEDQISYWCYQCDKEVSLESQSEQSELVCSECRNGFVETMATAQGVAHGRRVNNRPRRRHNRNERAENPYQRHALRVVRLLAQAAQSNQRNRSTEEAAGDGTLVATVGQTEGQPANSSEGISHGEELNSLSSIDGSFVDNQPNSSYPQAGNVSETNDNPPNLGVPQAGNASENDDNPLTDASEFFDDDDDENVLSIELDGWDSFEDEDEEEDENDGWEEVDEEQIGEEQGEAPVNEETNVHPAENTETVEGGERRPNQRRRDILRLRIRDWNSQTGGATLETSGRNLDWHEILQGLENNTIELRLSLPEDDTYVGNPEDYVDEAGYEILLQNFAENDNSRKGAPPAAKSAIENLPSVIICQQEMDSGAALCAICKDTIPLGEPGKQLPCLHLYHGDCIVPWLSSRNSCPICRYELPTDDPDYEEQKKQRSMVQSRTTNSGNVSPQEGGRSQVIGSSGNKSKLMCQKELDFCCNSLPV
eukprot:Gb_16547 [translate_table: standard]